MTEGIVFGEEAARKIIRGINSLESEGLTVAAQLAARGFAVYEGELTSAMAATTNGKTNPKKCKAKCWQPILGNTDDPVKMEVAEIEFDLVNRSNKLPAAPVGTYVIFVRLRDEWRPLWVDC